MEIKVQTTFCQSLLLKAANKINEINKMQKENTFKILFETHR